MFKTRLISGIFLVLAVVLILVSGGYVMLFTLGGVSLIGMQELMRAMGVSGTAGRRLEVTAYCCAGLYWFFIWLDAERYGLMAVILSLVIMLFVYVFSYPSYQAGQVMAAFFSLVYVAGMLSFIYLSRCLPDGKKHAALIFLCSWGCDTCAYCVGMLIGKHRMAPVLSPKKSVEGAVGGVIGAAVLGVIYASIVGAVQWQYALICAAGALISMVGDLAASAIKRNQNIKDYGTLIPGHGGILDRFDSVILTAPIIYYLARLFT